MVRVALTAIWLFTPNKETAEEILDKLNKIIENMPNCDYKVLRMEEFGAE